MSDFDREIELKINKDAEYGCWIWQGPLKSGRPHIQRGVKRVYIRRYLYEKNIGPLFDFYTLTTCDNDMCVNPDHVVMSNYADASVKKRKNEPKTSCKNGHPLDGTDKHGKRYCKICKAIRAKKPENVKKRLEYQKMHEDQLKEYRKEYYQKRREEISQKRKERRKRIEEQKCK